MPLLTSHCGFCKNNKHLLRCGGCQVMMYCDKDHQLAHRDDHKKACNAVKRAKLRMDHEEHKLRTNSADDNYGFTDLFENHVGHFWGIFVTRDYMRARYAVVEALGKIKTHEAVQMSLDHLMDMLRLCRGDNMGVRDLVPALMLRLGKDQECYDFVKWQQTTGREGDYDWGDMSLPFLDVKDADVFEPVDYIDSRFPSLSHTSAIVLLKIKLLIDLKSLQNSGFLGDTVPRELVDNIQQYVPQSATISGKKELMNNTNLLPQIENLSSQVDQLYNTVNKANPHFWKALLNPTKHLNARPSAYTHGSVQEMQLILNYSIDAWTETPGALDFLKKKVQRNH